MKAFSNIAIVTVLLVVSSVGNTAPTDSATSTAPTESASTDTQKNEIQQKDTSDRVMYSYAEATIDSEGTPSVQQLTIAKNKDGEYRFAKNQNGTMETGKWKGPLPSSPSFAEEQQASKIINSIVSSDLVVDPLAIFNQDIGNTLQDYLSRALIPLQFKK